MLQKMKLMLMCLLGPLALVCAGQAFAALPSVAIVGATPTWNTDVRSKLMATGQFSAVDIIDASTTTPTVPQLRAYKSILVYSDSNFLDASTLGNNVHTYLLGGGGVVVASFVFSTDTTHTLQGTFASNGDSPLTSGAVLNGTSFILGAIHLPGSPLLAGVASFNGGTASYYNSSTLAAGAVDVADWSNGTPLIATKLINGFNNIVALNFFPPSSDARGDLWITTTDGAKIMANALLYAGPIPAAPVPTLSEWSLILLFTLLALSAVVARRRQHQ